MQEEDKHSTAVYEQKHLLSNLIIKPAVEYQWTADKSHHRILEILGNAPGKTHKGKTSSRRFYYWALGNISEFTAALISALITQNLSQPPCTIFFSNTVPNLPRKMCLCCMACTAQYSQHQFQICLENHAWELLYCIVLYCTDFSQQDA